jgi:hypothetical protein
MSCFVCFFFRSLQVPFSMIPFQPHWNASGSFAIFASQATEDASADGLKIPQDVMDKCMTTAKAKSQGAFLDTLGTGVVSW